MGRKTQKISVIIPVYNVQDYVERCLLSVLNNTYTNLEVICVNDGSTDQSKEILHRIAEMDRRVVVISQANGGVASARNSGLEIATSEFVAFVDSDDWIHPQYFEILIDCQKKYNADIVCCKVKSVRKFQEYQEIDLQRVQIKKIKTKDVFQNFNIKSRVYAKLYRKKCLQNHRFQEKLKYEDIAFNLSVMCSNPSLIYAYVSVDAYFYFYRESSLIHTMDHRAIIDNAAYYLELTELAADNLEMQNFLLVEALKSAFSYRYLDMFNVNKKQVRQKSNAIIKPCMEKISKRRDISVKQKIMYHILARCPFIYRMFRILNDKTMLDWEKTQKKLTKQMEHH